MIVDVGLVVNVVLVLGTLAAIGGVLRMSASPRRAWYLALAAGTLMLSAWPLGVVVQRRLSSAAAAGDVSQGWSWLLLGTTAVTLAVTVGLLASRQSAEALDRRLRSSVLEPMVVAKMAVELDQQSVALDVLQNAIVTVAHDLDAPASAGRLHLLGNGATS